jgi:hypothetical protein
MEFGLRISSTSDADNHCHAFSTGYNIAVLTMLVALQAQFSSVVHVDGKVGLVHILTLLAPALLKLVNRTCKDE